MRRIEWLQHCLHSPDDGHGLKRRRRERRVVQQLVLITQARRRKGHLVGDVLDKIKRVRTRPVAYALGLGFDGQVSRGVGTVADFVGTETGARTSAVPSVRIIRRVKGRWVYNNVIAP